MKENKKSMTVSILSLSLLTVMAGAAVAPALGIIEKHFAQESELLVQMIISMPAIFIFITNLLFPRMCRHLKSKTLVMIGLLLYTVGGCAAGCFNSIYAVLAARALVGIGVGIIMPLSTGLLAYYFSKDKQESLMGYSSAMNQMGGVIATLLAGQLAQLSWRASFLVYLMGLISIVLCALFLPSDKIQSDEAHVEESSFSEYLPYIIAMFLLMVSFFIYPANFAIETTASKAIPQNMISVVMAATDLVAFIGGLLFVAIKKKFKSKTKLVAPLLFLAGYLLLIISNGSLTTLLGSFLIGFANGAGIPFLISEATKKAGKSAAATALPLISAALYLAQFLTPFIVSMIGMTVVSSTVMHLPYIIAAATSLLLVIWSLITIKN